jgi:hypothetical protein
MIITRIFAAALVFTFVSALPVQRADHLFHIEQFKVVSALFLRFMRKTLMDGASGCGPLTRTGVGPHRQSFAY